jgi:hypothetical protein
MKWLDDYRMRLVLFGSSAIVMLAVSGRAKADFVFGEPVKFGSIYIYDSDDIVCFSSDGLEMYIDRYLSADNVDLYVLKRAKVDDDWGPPVSLGPAVDSPQIDWEASISTDGLTLYFVSNRPGGYGAMDLYMTTRATRNDPWGPAVNLGPTINSSTADADVWISADGLELYFMSTRSGGYGGFDIWVTTRATENDSWREPSNLGPVVNSAYNEAGTWLSPDGLLLLLHDNAGPRPGGYGNSDFWMTRRASLSDPWQTPVNLGPKVNGPGMECLPRISPDGRTLYLWGTRDGVGNVWQAPIIPIVDFNGDGLVDAADMVVMIDHWHTDNLLCDIGPAPWGDGIVDVQDLIVLSEHLFEQVSDPTLVAHWPLNETEGMYAADSVGNNDAIVIGGAVWQPGSGQVDDALQLNGIDGCAIASSILNPADGAFSVLAWIKGGEPGQVLVSQQAMANWLATDTEGNLMTELKCTGRSAGYLFSETVITDGQWHRIGLVWDGSHRTLFVDGVVVAEDTQHGLEGSQMDLYIGTGKSMEFGTFFSGLIDDVRIYNRVVHP